MYFECQNSIVLKYLSSSTEDLITFLFLEKNSLIQLRNKNGFDSENYRRYISELDYKYVKSYDSVNQSKAR